MGTVWQQGIVVAANAVGSYFSQLGQNIACGAINAWYQITGDIRYYPNTFYNLAHSQSFIGRVEGEINKWYNNNFAYWSFRTNSQISRGITNAWNWINGNKWYQIVAKTTILGIVGIGIGALFAPITLGALAAAGIGVIVGIIWEFLSQGVNS